MSEFGCIKTAKHTYKVIALDPNKVIALDPKRRDVIEALELGSLDQCSEIFTPV
jgi:hypothetical protein